VTPTLFGPVPRSDTLACDEVFGPVLSVLPFEYEADAVALANATDYGLVAAVWTRDCSRQPRVAKGIRARQVSSQHLWRGRRRRASLRRHEEKWSRSREGFSRAGGIHSREYDRSELRGLIAACRRLSRSRERRRGATPIRKTLPHSWLCVRW
jgi:hypothetical protein